MVKTKFKRAVSLVMAAVLSLGVFANIGTTAYAASGTKSDVYIMELPRSGDTNNNGKWGHGELKFMNGWYSHAISTDSLRAMGSYSGNIAYCIEPGTGQHTGDTLTEKNEDYFNNLGSNGTISGDDIRLNIGRILQYGYCGSISTSWKSQNSDDADKLSHAIATQLLIWETIVGERDESFNHKSPGSYDAILDQIQKGHPLYSRIMAYYNSMSESVQKHTKVPSFCTKSSGSAKVNELKWDGSKYVTTLTDSNGVLGNYEFSANIDGVTFSKSGNKLTVSMTKAPSKEFTITATKTNGTRKGIVVWTDGKNSPGNGIQDVVSYSQNVSDPVSGFVKMKVSYGSCKIVKTSEDGKIDGINFTISGNGVNQTVTTANGGKFQLDNLMPGVYTVTEQSIDKYVPQEVHRVTVVAGQVATVNFNNVLKRGNLQVIKSSEDNLVEGVTFHLYGTSLAGIAVDEYAVTDKNGIATVAGQKMKEAYIATKEKAERSVNANENTAEEYAADKVQSGIDEISHDVVYAFDKAGRKGVRETKRNIQSAKDGFQHFKQQRAEQSLRKQTAQNTNSAIKTVDTAEKTIKQSASSSGKKTIKFAGKEAAKTTQKSVKTAEQTAKAAIKTSQQTAKAAQKTAQATVKASQKAAQAAKATAKATATAVKAAAKATIAAVKAIIAAAKSLVAAIAAGGWVAVVVIIVLCLVGLIAGSVYGIFFSGEDSGTGMSMQTVVQEINQEYDDRLEQEKNSVSYDVLEMSGSRAGWKDVLAVYSVKVNTNADNPMEVATVDDTKKQLLSDIFWEMNSVSSRTETKSHTEIEESDDGHGNIVETEKTVTETFLYITVSHKTVDEMATAYGFNKEQIDYLAELLKDENNQLWSQVLYGIGYSDDQIVSVALSQVGNVGGQPYWSWYGFDSRVEWCACFVSWCANECGYINAGIIPKYAGCVNGAQWFKDRGQWADRNYEPAPGTIIFFDWEGDGETDHTGIVQKCENGIVYTVEGNSGDACRQRQYTVGSSSIYGYGVPAY